MDNSSNDALGKRLEMIENRLNQLDAERAIAQTMYHYIEACDHIKDAERVSSYFTEDGIWEGGGNFAEFGETVGRDAIREMFVGNPVMLPFTMHYLTNPIIGVAMDGQSGWGKWQTLEAATLRDSSAQVWIAARYDNDFRKVGDNWLISHLRFTDVFVAPYEEGWLRSRYVSPLMLVKHTSIDVRPPAASPREQ